MTSVLNSIVSLLYLGPSWLLYYEALRHRAAVTSMRVTLLHRPGNYDSFQTG